MSSFVEREKLKHLYPYEKPNPELIKENLEFEKEDRLHKDNNFKTFSYSNDNSTSINLDNPETYFKIDLDESPIESKTCFQRWFSKIKGGSLRGSTFALASVTFGGGCLGFPQAMAYSGLLLGLIIFFFAAFFSYLTIRYLINIGIDRKIMDYNDLVKLAVNDKFRIFADVNNICLCLGVIMAYQTSVYNYLSDLLGKELGFDFEKYRILCMAICTVVVQIPLSLLKNISILQYASIVATISLVYTIIVVVIECPFYFSEYFENNPSFKISPFPKEPIGFYWLSTMGTFLFGFCNHNGVFQVFMEMDRPNKRRSIKVTNRSMILEIILYLSIALGGYFSFFDDSPGNFITRSNLKIFSRDYFIYISKITLIICLNCVMAINYNIMRLSNLTLIFNGKHPSFVVDLIITIIAYIFTNIIVYFVQNLTTILGIIGGVNTVVISFICPILIDIRLGKNPRYHWRNILNYILLVSITILGLAITGFSVYDAINPRS